jgi:hypothetical protein
MNTQMSNAISSVISHSTDRFKSLNIVDAIGDKHSQTIKVVGDTNEFNINQRSTGAAGSSIWVDVNGTGNKFTMSQTGNIDSVINIKSVSNSGTFNITQKN